MIWKDPVLSKVIAAAIIASIPAIWFIFNTFLNNYGWIIKIVVIISIVTILTILVVTVKLKKLKDNRTKLLLFLSTGGTCRDPMAKIITEKLIEEKQLEIGLNIRGMAVIDTSGLKISYAARHTIKSIYGVDLLSNYKCETITKDIYDNADLILVMSNEVMTQLQKKLPNANNDNKVYLFKEFFGLQGDITNPYPDGKDERTLKRYNDCANELKDILTKKFDHFIEALRF
jgi:protein-tyrosine-phosphatase